jgi:anhydro-N-acetylmuramic acid kinase
MKRPTTSGPRLYVGLMSGTSLDGVDAVLAEFSGKRAGILNSSHVSFGAGLRRELFLLNASGKHEINRAALAGNALARHYAAAVRKLLFASGKRAAAIAAIGCHGQTIRHRPDLGYTTQIGNPALLAELTGIRVVADFRSRDVAAGGQGAPLAPALHAAVFTSRSEDRAILNLGGIANLTLLGRGRRVVGFDSGPGNCLLDLWAGNHLGTRYDRNGRWAAGGQVLEKLLKRMLSEAYFAESPPKSTGRDLFNRAWLRRMLKQRARARDVQATLLELTARTVADALRRHGRGVARVIACGGGVHNRALMRRLAQLVAPAQLESSARHGIDPKLVEATAFAWLAMRTLAGAPGNIPAVTGARGPRVLGAVHPA